jgi:AAA ATPase domain
MEQIAEPGKTYVSEHTAKLVEGFVSLQDLGLLTVKGIKEPSRVYDLQGIGGLRTKLDVSRARGFSKFVGREREIELLESALERALEGNGQVVGIVAEAGVGKSRLCYEFAERCRRRKLLVLEGHCPAHGKTVPYMPILELWRSYFGITERDTATEARRKIAGTLLLLDEGFRGVLPWYSIFSVWATLEIQRRRWIPRPGSASSSAFSEGWPMRIPGASPSSF